MGTTHRSWKTRMPRVRRPWGASTSPRSARPLRTIAVLERATRKPRKTPLSSGNAGERGERGHGQGGERDLEAPAQGEDPGQPAQLSRRELQADREQEERDADLGERLDLVGVADPAEAARPEDGARHEEPRDGGQAQPAQDQDHGERRPEDDDEVAEDPDLLHGVSRGLS